MALIKCPECTKEVSSSAVSCPHCGFQITPTFASEFNKALAEQQAPTKKKGHISTGKGLLMILFGIVVVCFLAFLGADSSGGGPRVGRSGAFVDFINAVGQGTGKRGTLSPGTKVKLDHRVSDSYSAYLVLDGPYADHWALIRPSDVE
jgi:hypothetical protein